MELTIDTNIETNGSREEYESRILVFFLKEGFHLNKNLSKITIIFSWKERVDPIQGFS